MPRIFFCPFLNLSLLFFFFSTNSINSSYLYNNNKKSILKMKNYKLPGYAHVWATYGYMYKNWQCLQRQRSKFSIRLQTRLNENGMSIIGFLTTGKIYHCLPLEYLQISHASLPVASTATGLITSIFSLQNCLRSLAL